MLFSQAAATLLLSIILAAVTGCSNSGVESRQQSISNTQATILENRESRIQARDERMTQSRELIMQ